MNRLVAERRREAAIEEASRKASAPLEEARRNRAFLDLRRVYETKIVPLIPFVESALARLATETWGEGKYTSGCHDELRSKWPHIFEIEDQQMGGVEESTSDKTVLGMPSYCSWSYDGFVRLGWPVYERPAYYGLDLNFRSSGQVKFVVKDSKWYEGEEPLPLDVQVLQERLVQAFINGPKLIPIGRRLSR